MKKRKPTFKQLVKRVGKLPQTALCRPMIHTSDSQSAPASDEYRANWERIFGRRS